MTGNDQHLGVGKMRADGGLEPGGDPVDLPHGQVRVELQKEFDENLAAGAAAAETMDLLVVVEVVDQFADDDDLVPLLQAAVDKIPQGAGEDIADGLHHDEDEDDRGRHVDEVGPLEAAEQQGGTDGADDQEVLQGAHAHHAPHGLEDGRVFGARQLQVTKPEPGGKDQGQAGEQDADQPPLGRDRMVDLVRQLVADEQHRHDHGQGDHGGGDHLQAPVAIGIAQIDPAGDTAHRVEGQGRGQGPGQGDDEIGDEDDGVGSQHADGRGPDGIDLHTQGDGQQALLGLLVDGRGKTAHMRMPKGKGEKAGLGAGQAGGRGSWR